VVPFAFKSMIGGGGCWPRIRADRNQWRLGR
jgi:hypothetical protein